MAPVRGFGPYSLRPRKISDSRKKEGERKRKKQRVMVSQHDSDKFFRLEKELLPGIDNQVTLENITSRMPWMTLQTLYSVSPAWQQAIADRLTHEARVLTNSRETFVVLNNIIQPGDVNGIALLSLRDNVCYQLPPIPHVGVPWGSQCATLDGKVYIIGGSSLIFDISCGSRDVYVLDLAGRKHWQQCAKMQDGRRNFGCGVKHGKIYVIGGRILDLLYTSPTTGAEVYDPQENAWSAIKPMPSSNWHRPNNLKVATVGEELHVYYAHGKGNCSEYWAYNPVMDDWRTIVNNFGNTINSTFYMAQGKLCSVYLPERLGAPTIRKPRVLEEVLAVDGERLAMVNYENGLRRLIRKRGPGINTTQDFVWEKVRSISFGSGGTFMMCPIEL